MAVTNSNLPHWFRFSPTEEEAIEEILIQKITGNDKEVSFIHEIDFYEHEPSELPHFSGIATKDREWFFFTHQKRKHQNGNGIDRLTKDGYWKSTGNDKEIYSGESLIGKKKILVFHIGRPPKGKGTCWVMHEYRTTLKEYDGTKPGQKAFVICRLFNKEKTKRNSKRALAHVSPASEVQAQNRIKTKKKSKQALAHVSPALEVQAQTHQTSNPSCGAEMSDATMCVTTAPVEHNNDNDYHHNSYVAEIQVAEVTSSEVGWEVDKMLKYFRVSFSSPATSKSCFEEAQSMVVPASVPRALGGEVDDCSTGFQCFPAENSDKKSNTIAPIEYDVNGSNAYAAKNQVVGITADKMQKELVSSRPVTNDLNSGHCGHPQYGTNEYWDLLTNATDDEPLKKMVSVKDSWSCSGSDARLANAQRPFVLSCLFKKQDESIEVPNHDVAEPAVLSRTTAKSSPEDTQAELAPEPVSKLLGWKAENDPTSVECFIAEASDGSTSDTVAPVNYNNSNSYGVENEVVELPAPEPDPELARQLDMFYEPQFGPEDWTLFSSINTQMPAELGSSDISLLAPNDFISGNNGVQFQYGSNEPNDVSEFLNSVLCDPEECSYDECGNQKNLAYEGHTSMNTEVANALLPAEEIIDRKLHLQMETTPLQNPVSSGGGAEQIYDSSLKESNNHLSAFASGEVRNGFSITPRQRQNQPSNENSMTQMMQGTAPRRLRLQCKLQVRPLTTSLMSEDCSYTTEDHELKPVATEEEKASEKDAVASGHGAAASALSERRKILSDSTENCKTPQEPNTSMRPSFLTGINVVSLFSKAPPVRHSNWALALLFRVVLIAVLIIIFASIWRCLCLHIKITFGPTNSVGPS